MIGAVGLISAALLAVLFLSSHTQASTNTYYPGACKYIDASGALKFDGVCFITFGVQNDYYGDGGGQHQGFTAGAAFYDLLFPNGARDGVTILSWYPAGDSVDQYAAPTTFPRALVNRTAASVAERPFEPDQRGPATTVAILAENEVFIFDACGENCPDEKYQANGAYLWSLGEDGWLAIQGE